MTKRIKMILPVPMPPEAIELFKQQMPPALSRPDIEYEWVGTQSGANILDSYYDAVLSDAFVMAAGAKAEGEGFSAVCINSMSDSGLKGLRSRLSIPVFGPCHTSFLTACMLGKTFSVLTMWEEWVHMYEKTLKEEGLEHRCASIRAIGVRPDTQELLVGKEDIVFEKLESAGHAAIQEDGADVLILGSTTMHQSHAYLHDRMPVPVINPGVVAFKLCEMFLDLGLAHSKSSFPSPEKTNDDIFDSVPAVFE
ncbi:MAG: aspartate/glutamate racemase family protein [Rhodospirillaceae bacterium]|nr:aspartate/glutamate racemase family protein [Rhodospirillaceae bacterium]